MEKELTLDHDVHYGHTGVDVRRVQEWLCLHGHTTAIDGEYGHATEAAVCRFQTSKRILINGMVDRSTWAALTAPMRAALEPLHAMSRTVTISTGHGAASVELPQTCFDYIKEKVPELLLGAVQNLVVAYAKKHLAQNPREVGGQNRGPWVRLYCGQQGVPWCAGFVSYILRQAYAGKPPIVSTLSCDVLAAQARGAGLFVTGTEALKMAAEHKYIPDGSVFLIRSKPGDWTHTGIVTRATATVLYTIEGNTNDEGSREGYEVCARTRRLTDKIDFIVFK